MNLTKTENYKEIKSETCGKLLELLNIKDVPISITVAYDIKPTKNHAHKIATEIYWLDTGELDMEVTFNETSKTVAMSSGSILVISPGEFHKITKSSTSNKLIVISTPPWSANDELLE